MSKLRVHDMASEFGISVRRSDRIASSDGHSRSQPFEPAHRRPGRAHPRALGAREARARREAGRTGRADAAPSIDGCRCPYRRPLPPPAATPEFAVVADRRPPCARRRQSTRLPRPLPRPRNEAAAESPCRRARGRGADRAAARRPRRALRGARRAVERAARAAVRRRRAEEREHADAVAAIDAHGRATRSGRSRTVRRAPRRTSSRGRRIVRVRVRSRPARRVHVPSPAAARSPAAPDRLRGAGRRSGARRARRDDRQQQRRRWRRRGGGGVADRGRAQEGQARRGRSGSGGCEHLEDDGDDARRARAPIVAATCVAALARSSRRRARPRPSASGRPFASTSSSRSASSRRS